MHRLFSIGKDKRLFEYEISKAKAEDKLPVVFWFPIEQEACPSACIWYPKKDSKEGLLLTANDEYKMKVWNPVDSDFILRVSITGEMEPKCPKLKKNMLRPNIRWRNQQIERAHSSRPRRKVPDLLNCKESHRPDKDAT